MINPRAASSAEGGVIWPGKHRRRTTFMRRPHARYRHRKASHASGSCGRQPGGSVTEHLIHRAITAPDSPRDEAHRASRYPGTALASDVCVERGWLEAGKGGPYVPGRHPAEWGGFLVRPRVWAGPPGSAGAPPGDRRSRHRRGQAGPTPQTGRRGHRVIPGLRRVDGEGCERRPNVASGIPVPTFRGVRQLRSMRLGCQNRRLSNHTGRLTQLPIFRSTECLSVMS